MSSVSAGLGTYRSPGKEEMATANSKEAQELLLGKGTGHLHSHFLDQSASRPSLMGWRSPVTLQWGRTAEGAAKV